MSFGSPESRAMARKILQESTGETRLSHDDRDCLLLYCGAVYVNARISAGGWHLEGTAAYARGKEIRRRLSGPPTAAHLDPKLQRATWASITFEMAFHREPRAGDILRIEDLQRIAVTRRHDLEQFIQAWERQLPEMPCPFRVERERIFRRISYRCPPLPGVPISDGFEWQEATDLSPEQEWRRVEMQAFETYAKELGIEAPHCTAVVFLGVVDGQHRCRPLDKANIALTPEN